jgi:hypothetical protein
MPARGFQACIRRAVFYGYTDGSVQFLSDAISATNRQKIANRTDGQTYEVN